MIMKMLEELPTGQASACAEGVSNIWIILPFLYFQFSDWY